MIFPLPSHPPISLRFFSCLLTNTSPDVFSILHLAYSLLPDFSASKNFTFAATTPYTPSYPEPSFRYTFFCLQFLLMYTNSYAAQFTAITLRLRLFDIVP